MSDEKARIALLAKVFARSGPERAGIELGIGDDAAVLGAPPAPGKIVFTIDEQVEGQHFRRDLVSWRDVGWRSYMAAASDVAAMGAVPWCALGALVLPDDVDDAALEEIARGQRDASDAVGAPIVGGNLARGPSERGLRHGVSIATTLLGTSASPVPRGGARAGDGLWMAGPVGLAAAGLRALAAGASADPRLDACIAAWRRPRALVAEGQRMAVAAHAAVDVSDGLARDAGHIAEASGVCVVLEEGMLLADPRLIAAGEALGASPLELALYGGEDYALVAASAVALAGFRRVGEVREGAGLVLRGPGGERVLEAKGYDHFAFSLSS
ncbi:MAG TPA: thiamine-phosphate kinase [Polyangiaceae bacterium]|jgi:thiamine-monophosphate kinase